MKWKSLQLMIGTWYHLITRTYIDEIFIKKNQRK